MSLTRTQISLSEADRAVLDAARRRTGRSMSALIREAIHATYDPPSPTERVQAALASTFGVVSDDQDTSGEELVESVRSGRRLTGRA